MVSTLIEYLQQNCYLLRKNFRSIRRGALCLYEHRKSWTNTPCLYDLKYSFLSIYISFLFKNVWRLTYVFHYNQVNILFNDLLFAGIELRSRIRSESCLQSIDTRRLLKLNVRLRTAVMCRAPTIPRLPTPPTTLQFIIMGLQTTIYNRVTTLQTIAKPNDNSNVRYTKTTCFVTTRTYGRAKHKYHIGYFASMSF